MHFLEETKTQLEKVLGKIREVFHPVRRILLKKNLARGRI